MFKKYIFKKVSIILLIIFVLNLGLWNLFSAPMQVEACLDKNGEETDNCHSCNSTGDCIIDSDGPYWCAQCFGKCEPESSDINIVIPTPDEEELVNPAIFFSTVSDLYDGTNMAEKTQQELINIILNDEEIPEALKQYLINSIQNFDDTPENIKNLLIDIVENNEQIPEDSKTLFVNIVQNDENIPQIIKDKLINILQNDEKIPEDLKQYIINAINGNADIVGFVKDKLINIIGQDGIIPDYLKSFLVDAVNGNMNVTGLIKSWVLDLLLKHVDIEHICKSLSDIAANTMIWGTTVGGPLAAFITSMCPIILNEILEAFLQTLPEPPAPVNIQTIQYPIFESYQWEIGIPGLVKPGEVTEF